MSKKTELGEIHWINKYLASLRARRLNKHEIESILWFSLIWNMFEAIACNKRASIKAMEKAIKALNQRGRLQVDDFVPYLTYFTNRYTTNGSVNARFAQLNFRPTDREDLVRDVLTRKETNPVKTLLAMLIIVYRYRNNFFHGEKRIERIRGQVDNFRIANQLLMTFLDCHR